MLFDITKIPGFFGSTMEKVKKDFLFFQHKKLGILEYCSYLCRTLKTMSYGN